MRPATLLLLLLAAPAPAQQDPAADLFAAIKDHDTRTLKSLLAHGVSPSLRDPSGHGPLQIAAQNGDLDAMDALLAAGADIDATDRLKLTPLFYAANFNRLDAASFLLAHGATVDARDGIDRTPLTEAVGNDRADLAILLLKAGADPNALDRTKVPLIMRASLANYRDLIPILQKAGARYTSPQQELMSAAAYGDAIRIRELLAAGVPPDFDAAAINASITHGETPLMAAAEKGQTVAVRALLAGGASPATQDSAHRTALFYALKGAHRSTVDQLLAAGSDPTLRMGGGATTLIQLATFMDDPDLARKFLAAGVDPNAATDNGSIYTALHEAATHNHIQVLKVLLAAGADPNAQTVLEGDTPLIDAARSGATDCVAALLKAGADPTLRDHRKDAANAGKPGRTALDWAIDFHHPDIAALLDPRK